MSEAVERLERLERASVFVSGGTFGTAGTSFLRLLPVASCLMPILVGAWHQSSFLEAHFHPQNQPSKLLNDGFYATLRRKIKHHSWSDPEPDRLFVGGDRMNDAGKNSNLFFVRRFRPREV